MLERYSSREYFGRMRDAWQEVVEYVDERLSRLMARLPSEVRSRPLPMQADIVWGQRVLPNFRNSAQILDDAFIRLTHGDSGALRFANAVTSAVRGQYDFSPNWLDELEPGGVAKYWTLLSCADQLAGNVTTTASSGWVSGMLSHNYSAQWSGELDPPAVWPRYALDGTVQVRTGATTPESGVYLPDVANASAQFHIAGSAAAPALIGSDGKQYISEVPTVWTRVRRIDGQPVVDGLANLLITDSEIDSVRVPGGQPCPKTGWWFTPSQAQSRRSGVKAKCFRSSKEAPTARRFGNGIETRMSLVWSEPSLLSTSWTKHMHAPLSSGTVKNLGRVAKVRQHALAPNAYSRLTLGDADALNFSSSVAADVKGQYDFSLGENR
ncbi:hypothetical protein [Cupriavidus sp. AU9028]|uniref:hypothetical protein n=1 Tax=Cupriavidus sp. AU9028 TaxID=2871157 RepID=UPI002101E746|nr:hypothetical protein [Cupriavidus sp. AU9028]